MKIIDRLFLIMDAKNLKMSDLAEKLNVNKSVISTWKSRKTNPPIEYMERICEFLGISYDYFLTGEEKKIHIPLYDKNNSLQIKFNKLNKINKERVMERIDTLLELQQDDIQQNLYVAEEPYPYGESENYKHYSILYGNVAAGKGIVTIDDIEMIKTPIACDFALRVIGDSMEPKMHNNQIAYFKKTPVVDNGQIAAAQIEGMFDPMIHIKKIYIDGNKARLVSINPKYEDIICPIEKLQILGRYIDY